MDSILASSTGIPVNIPPPQNQSAQKEENNPVSQSEMAKIAMMGAGSNLSVGEKVTISIEGDKVTISKEGPDGWDKFKNAAGDTTRAVFRFARGMVEQDPSFAFRESLEVAKSSVQRMLPDPLSGVIGKGLYPCMRVVLTAIDVHKAVKTKRELNTSMADKLIDYGHVVTDAAGLLAIGGPMVPALARLTGGWAGFLAGAAVIGDIIAGAWHALQFTAQGLQKMKMEKDSAQEVPPQPPEVKVITTGPETKEAQAK